MFLSKECVILSSEPEGTRTPNLLVRSQMLYPIKLQVRDADANITKFGKNNRLGKINSYNIGGWLRRFAPRNEPIFYKFRFNPFP